ncbi:MULTISPECIES: 2'-5' RNA ligase family protein [Thermomonosporaceae]|uniref:2'-5' RNA ligase family protein n=1 Tax=Thermomonosporaceae TaxID=2012 RepID=UPI00255AB02E|nr:MULTISPECIES: 2'-5' RNA ligase family protein [Thermomonosporaceae]MDL4774146.1 2'-5' RNA ligase family protein [Actinomadura xylanilytica]
MSPLPEHMSDHWWWRPGVRPGRRLLVWHILLDSQPAVRDLVRQYQDKLAGLEGLDFVPPEWLHMTTQVTGFCDEISPAEVDAMTTAVAGRLAMLDPIEVEIGKLWFHSEAVMLSVRPARALDPVRLAIRESVAETVRAHQLADEPDWTPHVSVAYSHGTGPAGPIIDALEDRPGLHPFKVGEVHLVEQQRTGRLYSWDRPMAIALGT